MRPFGYHITGGIHLGSSLKEAVDSGFTSAQVFLGPPQKYDISKISDVEMALFLRTKRESGVKVYVHAPYVLHAFAKPENAEKNNSAIKRMLRMCDQLEMDGFVLHMGGTKWYSPVDSSMSAAADSDQAVWYAAEQLFSGISDCKTTVLLENCANGNDLSGSLPVICDLIKNLRAASFNVGLCLDTCHAWAWGHDLNDFHALKAASDIIGPYLDLIHLNSAPEKVTCGGKYDRHESLNKGVIARTAFATLLKWHPSTPLICERDDYQDVLADRAFVSEVDQAV